MSWKPDREERPVVQAVSEMAHEALVGRAIVSAETFAHSLRTAADALDKKSKKQYPGGRDGV